MAWTVASARLALCAVASKERCVFVFCCCSFCDRAQSARAAIAKVRGKPESGDCAGYCTYLAVLGLFLTCIIWHRYEFGLASKSVVEYLLA